MKKPILITLMLMSLIGVAYAQFIASDISQRIQNAQQKIDNDQQDISYQNAYIQNIIDDQQANAITSQIPAVQIIDGTNIPVPSQQVNAIQGT